MNERIDVLAVKPAEHWEDQAELALAYAKARPASDLKGFFAALRDAADFNQRAALSRVQGGAE